FVRRFLAGRGAGVRRVGQGDLWTNWMPSMVVRTGWGRSLPVRLRYSAWNFAFARCCGVANNSTSVRRWVGAWCNGAGGSRSWCGCEAGGPGRFVDELDAFDGGQDRLGKKPSGAFAIFGVEFRFRPLLRGGE